MAFGKKDDEVAVIQPANMLRITVPIQGTAPYVQNKFSQRQREALMKTMSTPSAAKKSKAAREPRDFDRDYEQSQHKTVAGWTGIHCGGLRKAMIDACRTVNLVMTRAKLALFVIPDGFDVDDGTPLVRVYPINGSELERSVLPVRNDNGSIDLRVRAMLRQWRADVTIEFDADMITAESVVNLLDRAGRQVGIGEGRNFSKDSTGIGWGSFTVVQTPAA